MKKLAVLFALVAPSTTMIAECSGRQKETVAAGVAPETTAETTAKETDSETTAAEETMAEENIAEEDEENYNTGDASLDNTRSQDEIGENELLVVGFGTSYDGNRRLTVGATENAIEKAFPDYSVKRGPASQTITGHVESRDQIFIDNIEEALDRAVDNKVKNLVIQPVHLMNGLECTDLADEAAEYSDALEKVTAGEPLLATDDDFKVMIRAITEATARYDDGETVICLMSHGTGTESNQVYSKMQDTPIDAGYNNYYMKTMEASPTVENILAAVQVGGYKKVVLEPLVTAAGDHASNDMAGDEEGSWRKIPEDAGYEVTCLVRGFGEVEAIQQLFVEHVKTVVESLSE